MSAMLSRRSLLLSGLAMAAAPAALAQAQPALPAPTPLRATTRTLDVNGRAATVLGLLREDGQQGVVLEPNEQFRVALQNDLAEPSIIHWHGQVPPVVQDGVPNKPLPMLAPGEARAFNYTPTAGTHWMHAHIPDQEFRHLAAPLIVRTADDLRSDRQEVVMFLSDFSFTTLAEHLERLGREAASESAAKPGAPGSGMTMGGGSPMPGMAMPGMAMPGMAMPGMAMPGMAMPGMAMDINDIDFDAYLVNDRTLADPEQVRVERGGRVLLRVINAASATVFRINTGALPATLLAVDGQPVVPMDGADFALGMGQRADLLVEIPSDGGAFPVLALREGAAERAGLILATNGARVGRVELKSAADTPVYASAQEAALRAKSPLARRPVDRRIAVNLTGTMAPYVWTVGGSPWGSHRALNVRSGERVEIAMLNRTMMAHPMHLHGHHFQVVEVDGQRVQGALRDTVQVPAMGRVSIAFDAGEAAPWVFHCHHMPHLASGMMTEVVVEG